MMPEEFTIPGPVGVGNYTMYGRPLLSVCILTVGWRLAKFLPLLEHLVDQALKQQQWGVEIVALYNHGEYRVAQMRQQLLMSALGTYVAFVDDDDWVSDNYCERICQMLYGEEFDTLGFQVQLEYRSQLTVCSVTEARKARVGVDGGPVDGVWYEPWGIMTPTRTSLARQCRFDSYAARVGEDGWFKRQIVPLVSYDAYVPEVLYHYRWDENDSSERGWHRGRKEPRRPRPELSSPVFRWHSWSAP